MPVNLVQRLWLGINLGAQPRGRLVDQVNGLIGQEAVADVTLRKSRGSQYRRIGDANAVVNFVTFLESAQDADRILHRWFFHHHRLEAAFESWILLNMFMILVQRGRADQV